MSKIPLSVFLEAMREERDNLARRVEAIDMLLSTYDEGPLARVATPKNEKVKKSKKRHCKACGEPGHRSDNCPNGDGTLPPDEVPEKREITKETVDGLRKEHPTWDTLKIAAELKCRLSGVNKFW
jgi:hypothetical protein